MYDESNVDNPVCYFNKNFPAGFRVVLGCCFACSSNFKFQLAYHINGFFCKVNRQYYQLVSKPFLETGNGVDSCWFAKFWKDYTC